MPADTHVGDQALDEILDALDELERRIGYLLEGVEGVDRRITRVETRHCRLMGHLGLDNNGDPIHNPQSFTHERHAT